VNLSTHTRQRLFSYGIVVPFAVILAFPFVWMAITSLKFQGDVYNPTKTWSFDPTLENYGYLFHHTGYLRWIRNSCLVGLMVTLITLVVAVPAGYALARLAGRMGRGLGVAIFLTYLVPPTLLFLPFSRVIAEVNLQDRLWALILVYPSFTIPFAVWLLMGFFKSIPPELEDAALIDGCGPVGAMWRVMLPVAIPGLITTALFTFFASWNEFFAALILISDQAKFTLPVTLTLISSGTFGSINWGLLQAGVALTIVPCIVIYLLLQRYYVGGLLSGALK